MNNLTIEQLEDLSKNNKYIANFKNRFSIETYDEFIEQLYKDIELIITDLEETRDTISQTEDSITVQIKNNLKQQCYSAEHGVKDGGHVDLKVQFKDFKWIGEAKKWGGAKYIYGGVEQLITRYTTGLHNQTNGGVLIYFFCGDIKSKISELIDYIDNLTNPKFTIEKIPNSFSFVSIHTHQTSELDFKIKYFPAIFHFAPNDLSAKKRKNKIKPL